MNLSLNSPEQTKDALCKMICTASLAFSMLLTSDDITKGIRSIGWCYLYIITVPVCAMFALASLRENPIVAGVIDIGFYEFLFSATLLFAYFVNDDLYFFMVKKCVMVVYPYLFLLTIMRIVWPLTPWPLTGFVSYFCAEKTSPSLRQSCVVYAACVFALPLLTYLSQFAPSGWSRIVVGAAGLVAIAQFGKNFVASVVNTVEERQEIKSDNEILRDLALSEMGKFQATRKERNHLQKVVEAAILQMTIERMKNEELEKNIRQQQLDTANPPGDDAPKSE